MKPYFTNPINSLEEAHAFFDKLNRDGLLFHPEDSPESIVDIYGIHLFTPDECTLLEQRIAEVYLFDADPCTYCLTLGDDA